MKKNKKYLEQAITTALKNIEENGGPFGSVIVKDEQIIAVAGNSVTKDNDPTAHAEVNAIRQAVKKLNTIDLSGCEIYSSCEPCPMCLGAIYWARIDKLFFAATKNDAEDAGFSDKFIYQELNLPYKKRKLETHNLLREKALVVFEQWKNKKDKIEY